MKVLLNFLRLSYIAIEIAHSRLLGIPTVPFNTNGDYLDIRRIGAIVVDFRYIEAVDEVGDTLIPPTLHDFATTFAGDLSTVEHDIPVQVGRSEPNNTIFLTLGDPNVYRDAAGRKSSEGYSLSVLSSGVRIEGASPLGVWWGTRTLLQQLLLANGSLPLGNTTDTPGWPTRGMMLDAGRHYYPPEFLAEMCAYMSFFKQNTFHLHLSDNLYNNVNIYSRERSLSLYSRFRLWSNSFVVAGLNKYQNESYTKEQFDSIQSACATRGVTIVPEIEAPGHALVFVQWKPELGLHNDLSLLNISHPDTITTLKAVWSTFLPWFQSKKVHIGADEYTGDINDYNTFVNAMADHIYTVSNKSIRIWGTFPPKYSISGYSNIYQNVSIQHWEYFEDNPLFDYIKNNYSVLNSDDTFYVVNKWSGSYPPSVPISKTFSGNPTRSRFWYPYIFDTHNSTNNPSCNESRVLGAIAPLWNDYGPNASVYSEAYYAWRAGIPALADKQWGGDLRMNEFEDVLEALQVSIPGQNLERKIQSKSMVILEYSLVNENKTQPSSTVNVPDASGNGYHGWTNCQGSGTGSIAIDSCSIITPLTSKGRDFSLTLSILVHSLDKPTNATLISGKDSTLMLTPNITFLAGGNYYRLNSTLPLGQKNDLRIIARGNQTFAKVNNESETEFLAKLGINGVRFEWAPIAFEAPLREIGGETAGWKGEIFGIKLTGAA